MNKSLQLNSLDAIYLMINITLIQFIFYENVITIHETDFICVLFIFFSSFSNLKLSNLILSIISIKLLKIRIYFSIYSLAPVLLYHFYEQKRCDYFVVWCKTFDLLDFFFNCSSNILFFFLLFFLLYSHDGRLNKAKCQ